MENVHYLNHPVLKHKISMLRDKSVDPALFRSLIGEIGALMTYEALASFPTVNKHIATPIEEMDAPFVEGKDICFVSILRAGLEMGHGARDMLPAASEGFIAMARDETTFKPHLTYSKLPASIEKKKTIILDPMLATGGSSIAAINLAIQAGVRPYAFLCIIAAPEGVKAFHEAFPDIQLYVGQLDRELNEKAYICPGLGDAGDRIYNTLD